MLQIMIGRAIFNLQSAVTSRGKTHFTFGDCMFSVNGDEPPGLSGN